MFFSSKMDNDVAESVSTLKLFRMFSITIKCIILSFYSECRNQISL